MAILYEEVKKQYDIKVSLQNLYRTVGQMVEKQILVREGKKISLNFVWITHQIKFTENIRQTYITVRTESDIPRTDGERHEFTAESLAALDPQWNDVIAEIAGLYKDPTWYEYNSHPWHFLAMSDTEDRLYESLGTRGYKLYGNDTFLDRYGTTLAALRCPKAIAKDSPFPKEGYSLWVCEDYIVECVFPEVLSKHFAFFFHTIHSIDEFNVDLFSSIFRMKIHCKIVVRKSTKNAKELQGKIAAYFSDQSP